MGMQSTSRTTPSAHVISVSSTRVPGRYRRRTAVVRLTGAMRQRPFSSVPSNAEKHAAESKRGRQSQSIEPAVLTRPAVCVSPMRA
jgi:hypothetical protein